MRSEDFALKAKIIKTTLKVNFMNKPAVNIPGTTPPRTWSNLNKNDYILIGVVLCFFLWTIWQIFGGDGRAWRWDALLPYIVYENKEGNYVLGMFAKGFFMTVRLGIWAFVFAMVFGLLVGSYTANKKGFAVLPFTIFVQTLRNIPPLIFIFLIYFFSGNFFSDFLFFIQDFTYTLSASGLEVFSYIFAPPMQIEGMTAAILALGLYEGVYIAEIVRSSIESIPKTQREAASSLGFNRIQSLWYILLPQAKPIMLPPLAGQTVSIFKDSALAALVSLPELTFQSLEIMAVTRLSFEVWILCMVCYFAISRVCTWLFSVAERRVKWKPLV